MKLWQRFAVLSVEVLLCALAVGCATTTEPIQFGLYQVPRTNLVEARALGMDFVVGPRERGYLEEAGRAGLKVITPLTDEPDLHGISPENLREEYRKARKPAFLNLSSGYSVEAYRDVCDVVMFDWYPVGWMPVETFYSHCRTARLAAGKKPFYAVVQTFDWAKYPGTMPPGDYRRPTAPEVKAMTLWAAMNGASGIVFYPFDDGHARLSESPEIAGAIKESVELVRNYDWLFESPRVWIEYPFSFKPGTDKTNAIAETSIAIRAARTEKALFVVAANTTGREIVVKPRMKFEKGGEELRFAPLEVKFLTTPPPPPGRGGK
jgi:hypothetical protein